MTDYISMIGAEIEAKMQDFNKVPESVGMLRIRSANRTLSDAKQEPDAKALWKTLWYENEVSCLFSDSGLGKSLLAVQIGVEIAVNQRVLYIDLELSQKQFQHRYTDDETGELHKFPNDFYRVEIDRDALISQSDNISFEDAIINDIESAALRCNAKVLIIDNLSFLCVAAEKGDAATTLMKRLTDLKKKHGLSLLVVSHTPKRSLYNPLTQNDLRGSKMIFNFIDSCFALGRSAKDTTLRYLKQLKTRQGAFDYDSDNVIIYEIRKEGAFTGFHELGTATEREHLKEPTENDRSGLIGQVKELAEQGKTQREIASLLGLGLGTVNKYLKK